MKYIYEDDEFEVHVPPRPFVDRAEGGHVVVMARSAVRDRTQLSVDHAMKYMLLTMIAGEALTTGMKSRGVDIGIVNYQEMGNWSVFAPDGPRMHTQIFGRAVSATKQAYGEAVKLPFRESGFYDDFQPLDDDDIAAVRREFDQLMASDKYVGRW